MVNAIHIGIIIKEELYRQNISVSDFAKKINKSRNVIYDIFNRESIDTALLNKIGKILHCDFFSLYSAQPDFSDSSVRHFNAEYIESAYTEKLAGVLKQNETMENEIVYLKKIIALLEKGKQKPS